MPPSGLRTNGYSIPAGTIISVPQYTAHRDTEVYGEDAEIFRAERWLEADSAALRRMDQNFLAVSLFYTSQCLQSNLFIVWSRNSSVCWSRLGYIGDSYVSRRRIEEVRYRVINSGRASKDHNVLDA